MGVETGSIYDEELSGQKNTFSLRRYADTKAGVTALTEGEIDAWKDDEIVISASEMKRQGIKISAPEEIGYRNGWISKEALLESAALYGKSPYGAHLRAVAEERIIY